MVRIARLVAARPSIGAARESARGPLDALDRSDRRGEDAGRISADIGGAFIRPPPPAKRRGGVGGGGCLRKLALSSWRRFCRCTPHPRPLPATRCARWEGRRYSSLAQLEARETASP